MDQFDAVVTAVRRAEPQAFQYFVERYQTVPGTTPGTDRLLSGVVTAAVDEVMPAATANKNVPPAKFSWDEGHGFGWAIFLVISGIIAFATSNDSNRAYSWILIAGAAVAVVVHLIWASVANGSEQTRLARARKWEDARVKQVNSTRAEFWWRVYDAMLRDLARYTVGALGIPKRLEQTFAAEFMGHKDNTFADWASRIQAFRNSPEFPAPPSPAAEGVAHEEYERVCCRLLQSLGYISAKVTRYSRDGGIDIESDEVVAQCKHYTGSVGARDIRELNGVAAYRQKKPVFFTSGSYTRDAIRDAQRFGVALFIYNERTGSLQTVNRAAEQVKSRS